jgi:LacI family transcriptional regulator
MKVPSPQGSPVTQKDLAAALGVALGTVSMALRDDPRITPARRREIQTAAVKMGYRPNPAATALAHFKHASTVKPVQAVFAWLNLWPDPRKLRRFGEFDLYWKGAFATAEKFGYRLEEFACSDRMPLARVTQILLSRGIEGLLLPPHEFTPDWAGFPWERFSTVRFGRSLDTPETLVVTADQVANMMLAFRRVRDLGYERIGFVAEPPNKKWHLFEAGFLMAQQKLPLRQRLAVFRANPGDPRVTSQKELERWLRREKPDAVITTVAQAQEMLGAAGLRVPEDIGLSAMSVLDGNATAGIDQHSEEIGRTAALSLISLIHDHDRGPSRLHRELLVKGSWIDGPSCPPRTSATLPATVEAPAPAQARQVRPAGPPARS